MLLVLIGIKIQKNMSFYILCMQILYNFAPGLGNK